MNDTYLLIFGVLVFGLMVIGMVLTVVEFSRLSDEDATRTDSKSELRGSSDRLQNRQEPS